MLRLNPLETKVFNPEEGDCQDSCDASWVGGKANSVLRTHSVCPHCWYSQQGWQLFMLAFCDVGTCQPPLKSRSTIYFVEVIDIKLLLFSCDLDGLKPVSWKRVFLILSYSDSLISWKSHLPIILEKKVSNFWAHHVFSPPPPTSLLYCCCSHPVIVCCLAITNDCWIILWSVALQPLLDLVVVHAA